jgi:leucyl aminopeptidase (aminopeptidase T)
MDFDNEMPGTSTETGSDELLSDDHLRLPESANILVRTHAVRAWLARRYKETTLEIGEAALALQQTMVQEPQETRLRRRERQNQEWQLSQRQQQLQEAQQRLDAYEEAQALLEDCIAHTSGERVLVEYYLVLEDLVQSITEANRPEDTPRLQVFADVQHRVEHVGAPHEDE